MKHFATMSQSHLALWRKIWPPDPACPVSHKKVCQQVQSAWQKTWGMKNSKSRSTNFVWYLKEESRLSDMICQNGRKIIAHTEIPIFTYIAMLFPRTSVKFLRATFKSVEAAMFVDEIWRNIAGIHGICFLTYSQ